MSSGTPPEINAPANTGYPEHTALNATACQHAGACVAGGSYQERDGAVEPMVLRLAGGHWSGATMLSLPRRAPRQPYGEVNGLACGGGTCTAVGDYVRDSQGDLQAFVGNETGGRWAPAFLPAPPPSAATPSSDSLAAITCTGPGSCEAVGRFRDKAGQDQIMVAAKATGQPWGRAVEVPAPTGAARNPAAALNGIACTSPGWCVAVGTYHDAHNHVQAMATVQVRGRWQRAVRVAAPAGAARAGFAALRSVSCASGTCLAVGEYAVSATANRAMSVTLRGGHVGPATAITAVPVGAGKSPTTDLTSVACRAAGQCVAVGVATNRAGRSVAMDEVQVRGRWSAAFLRPPANAGTGGHLGSSLYSVACPAPGVCVAVGYYNDNSGGYRAEAA